MFLTQDSSQWWFFCFSSRMPSPPLLFLLFLFPLVAPFTTVNNVTLQGDAHLKNQSIVLTQERTCLPPSPPNPPSGIGTAFFHFPIRFLDSATKTAASFSSRFSISIVPTPLCPPGDGLTFLIASNSAYVPRLRNGRLGLPEPASGSGESFLAVEFDTSFDPDLGDVNGNHFGLDLNTPVSIASADASGFDIKSGRTITTWIDYSDAAKTIQVWVGLSLTRPRSPVLSARVDLSKYFREFMNVGFSASNGERGSAVHLVKGWRFKTYGFAPFTAPMDVAVEGGDCFLCSPEDSDGNDVSDVLPSGRGINIAELLLGLGGLAAFLVSAIGISVIGCCLMRRRRRRCGGAERDDRISRIHSTMPATLTLAEVQAATAGFNPSRIIGEGASATVYEGVLPSGETVAVKRFGPRTRRASLRHPFSNEFGTMARCLPNGSLDGILHGPANSAGILPWGRRLMIVHGVAAALSYLHEECERQVIHRDVKACNIMLDAEFNAKLGDFGLAVVYEHSSLTRDATIPAGTMGYLAPEYVYSGVPTEKTDVYSFGVVVLEVATGRRPVEEDGVVVSDWVWEMWEGGRLMEAADRRLRGGFDAAEMTRMLVVGLCCVHPDCERRPRVKEAARMLRGETQLPVLPAKKPSIRIRPPLPKSWEEFGSSGAGGSPPAAGPDEPPWFTPRSHFSRD